jgi:hypothetical protein
MGDNCRIEHKDGIRSPGLRNIVVQHLDSGAVQDGDQGVVLVLGAFQIGARCIVLALRIRFTE